MNYGFDLRGRSKLSESMDICGLIKFFVLVISYLFFFIRSFRNTSPRSLLFSSSLNKSSADAPGFKFRATDCFTSEWFCESNTIIVGLNNHCYADEW